MRQLQIGLLLMITLMFASCTDNSQESQNEGTQQGGQVAEKSEVSEGERVIGEWTLSSFIDDGKVVELTECDGKTTWNFTTEPAEALGDGTAVQKLNATAPDECEYYSFDAKWTVQNGQLFVSTSRIGGLGGNSLAGLMKIKDLTDTKLVVEIMKKELTFER